MSDKLKIDLEPQKDRSGNTYYLGKIKGPFTIDCSDGVAFLIFISNPGEEEMNISSITQKKYNNDNER
jgi:hypothetical protein